MANEKATGKRVIILEAAASVFSRRGYHKTRIEDIAVQAGIGKGTIYEYFVSKEQLFKEMIKEGFDLFIKKIEREVKCGSGGCGFFEKIIDTSLKFMEDYEDVTRLIITHPSTMDEDTIRYVYNRKCRIKDMIANILECHIKAGEIRPVDARIAAHVFLNMLFSLISEKIFNGKQFDIVCESEKMMDIYLYGLAFDAVNKKAVYF